MSNRPVFRIASDIRKHWNNPYFGARPYLAAMNYINDVNDPYIVETGADIIRGFLANSQTWRGEHARRIKTELKNLLKES